MRMRAGAQAPASASAPWQASTFCSWMTSAEMSVDMPSASSPSSSSSPSSLASPVLELCFRCPAGNSTWSSSSEARSATDEGEDGVVSPEAASTPATQSASLVSRRSSRRSRASATHWVLCRPSHAERYLRTACHRHAPSGPESEPCNPGSLAPTLEVTGHTAARAERRDLPATSASAVARAMDRRTSSAAHPCFSIRCGSCSAQAAEPSAVRCTPLRQSVTCFAWPAGRAPLATAGAEASSRSRYARSALQRSDQKSHTSCSDRACCSSCSFTCSSIDWISSARAAVRARQDPSARSARTLRKRALP
mmetsp:Transcript_94636/g.300288  ORF Transcript_94636/g.300288 Transcript_94636/m.300288 type:complete len:308 (-) Transcript_94636:243-1166(-)